MKISLISRPNGATKWAGDQKALYAISEGLQILGHQATVVQTVWDLPPSDFVFLSNTCLDLRSLQKVLQLQGLPYGLIGFHEDTIQFFGPSMGFYHYIRCCLDEKEDEGIEFSLEALYENPHVIHYYAPPPRRSNLVNYEVLKQAQVCVANTPTEAKTMQRDCPSCKIQVVPLSPGFAEDFCREPTDEFLTLTGLPSKGYILQVGRLEFRKNQLGSILATKDLDVPLVFIATKGAYDWYETTCIDAILKWRKAPTIIISQTMAPRESGPLKILSMPNGEKLPTSVLQSAFAHAGLHLHPAFQEMPGYTYFESAALGTPTIASDWTTIRDYLGGLDDRVEYCHPYDLPAMTLLIQKKLGENYEKSSHSAFTRTKVNMARELLALITA